MDDRIQLKVLGLTGNELKDRTYALVFEEVNGNRRLPIIIGEPEAQSIIIKLDTIKIGRPLTHDLMKNIFDEFHMKMKEAFIYKFSNGAFHAYITLSQFGKEVKIDSRTSDAVAFALRTDSPIYTTKEIMDVMSFRFEPGMEGASEEFLVAKRKGWEESLPVITLEDMLKSAIDREDYEQASVLRDLINNRKDKNCE